MAKLIELDTDDNEVQCDECESIFTIVFQRQAAEGRVEFCPFCGDGIEEIVPKAEG